jgi:hypothetical protein
MQLAVDDHRGENLRNPRFLRDRQLDLEFGQPAFYGTWHTHLRSLCGVTLVRHPAANKPIQAASLSRSNQVTVWPYWRFRSRLLSFVSISAQVSAGMKRGARNR